MHMFTTRFAFPTVAILLGVAALAACGEGQAASGDPAKGQQVFATTDCAACHMTSDQKLVGPGLAGLFRPGGPKLPSGVDYQGNLPNGKPIDEQNVAEWIKTGGIGKIGQMPAHTTLTPEQITDLIAYLKTL
jgi:cytochrome c